MGIKLKIYDSMMSDNLQECSRVDLDVNHRDEFEEFRARSYSGGFLNWHQHGCSELDTIQSEDQDQDCSKCRDAQLEILTKLLEDSIGNKAHEAPINDSSNRVDNDLCVAPPSRRASAGERRSPRKSSLRRTSCPRTRMTEAEPIPIERTRHLSLKASPKNKLSSNSNQQVSPSNSTPHKSNRANCPPSIQVSLHRQVATHPPAEWDFEDHQEDNWYMGTMRPRVLSLPSGPQLRANYRDQEHRLQRVRSFTITRKGLKKEYASRSNSSICTCDSTDDIGYQGESISPQLDSPSHSPECGALMSIKYTIIVVGGRNVGKSTIIKRFVTENETSFSFDDDGDKCVSIVLDGVESMMEFINIGDTKDKLMRTDIDAYVVVYSVEDRLSFEMAINHLYEIRESDGHHIALILVANKTDLVRSRTVPEEEGRAAAKTYESKYIEVSAAIDLKIEELLVGVLKQIRLFQQKYKKSKSRWKTLKDASTLLDSCCLLQARENVLAKIFNGGRPTSKSCDNLYVL